MEKGLKQINRSERLYNKNKSVKRGFAFLLDCYTLYLASKDGRVLNKGYIEAVKIAGENSQSIPVWLCCALFSLTAGEFEQAERIISRIGKYTKFLKNNDADSFSFYCYICALNKIHQNGTALPSDMIKALEENTSSISDVFLADIYIFFAADYKKSGAYLKSAYVKGNRSRLFFLILLKFFNYKKENNPFDELLIPLFKWGCARQADISDIVEINADKISLAGFGSLQLCFKLYNIYRGRNIVIQIIGVLMNNFDYGYDAYCIYRDAVYKQVEDPDLIEFFIKSSFKLEIEKIGVYPLKQYLLSPRAEDEIKAFVYHIILNDGKYSSLKQEYERDIIEYGFKAFSQGKNTKYYYSIYKFITDLADKYHLDDYYTDTFLRFLSKVVMCCEIKVENKNAAYVRVKQKETREMTLYPVENQRAYVFAVSDSFSLYVFDKENKEILSGDTQRERYVKNSDFAFYLKLYKKGFANTEVMIYLAMYFIRAKSIKGENMRDAIDILVKVNQLKEISRNVRMRIMFKLGSIFCYFGDTQRAVKFLSKLDLNYISDKNIDYAARLFLDTGIGDLAVSLAMKKPYALNDETMFKIIRQAARNEKYNLFISSMAYEFLIKKHYDSSFVEIVNSCYSGSIEQLIKLSRVLEQMNVSDRRIDEKILKQSIFAKRLDEQTEQIFLNIYFYSPESAIIEPFIQFICYMVIVEEVFVGMNTTKILENEFISHKKIDIAAALLHIYVNQGITTEKFYGIIEDIKQIMGDERITFPCVLKSNSEQLHSPYFDKFTALCFNAPKGSEIFVHYRRSGKGKFRKKKMRYFKYGIYYFCIRAFYGERIEYFFSQEMENGSINTETKELVNNRRGYIYNSSDDFYELNEAFYNNAGAKYVFVENYICSRQKKPLPVKGRLL